MAVISPSRKAAFEILLSVEQSNSRSDDLLRGKRINTLSIADRNLATILVLGTLRWQIRLDHQIKVHLKHPNAKLDVEVLIALRLGAFQLLHLDRIPARAAIDESVELTKQSGHRFASGMVNAVLRKVSSIPAELLTEDLVKSIALSESHPEWMVDRWAKFYGHEGALNICRHGQRQAPLTVRIQSAEVEAELGSKGVILQAGELLAQARTVVSGDVIATNAFREGRVRIQDEGSQLVAELVLRGNEILDCCAAPGGKTLILAERNPSAHIVACEASSKRHSQLEKRLEPFGERIECRLIDATKLPNETTFDSALADVPCSGTGTLGRNPEIRNRLRPEDLLRQADRQRAILVAASRALRPGGHAIYSTCSLEPEENELVIFDCLFESSDIKIVSLRSRLEGLRAEGVLTEFGSERLLDGLTPEGFLRLFPYKFDTDGFFVCLLERSTGDISSV